MKRTLIITGVVLLAAIVIAFLKRPDTTSTHLNNSTNNLPHSEDSNNPDTIVVSNEWKRFVFPGDERNYYHTLEISYPSNWYFECCGDSDTSSTHMVNPFQSSERENFSNTNKPNVIITEFSLALCQDGTSSCEIDKVKPVTPAQFYNFKKSDIVNNKEFYDYYDGMVASGTKVIANLNTTADVFVGTYREKPVRSYLLNSGKGIVMISFVDYEKLPTNFESNFLAHLEPLY
jgi:hypothetical protein